MSKKIVSPKSKKVVSKKKVSEEKDEIFEKYKEITSLISKTFPSKNSLKGDSEFLFLAIGFNPKTGEVNHFGCGQHSIEIFKLLANQAQRRLIKMQQLDNPSSFSGLEKMLLDVIDIQDKEIIKKLCADYGIQNN